MRKESEGKNPYYNLEKEDIREKIENYFERRSNSDNYGEVWEGTKQNTIEDTSDPKDHEYGGFWYRKGKRSCDRLMKFYEICGYKEDPDIHLSWKCFSEVPFPTMRLIL